MANEKPEEPSASASAREDAPKPAVMFCPFCGKRHVDEGVWETRPHHKHLCLGCHKLFRFEGDGGEYFYGTKEVVDRELDRAATWRTIGVDPEQAERNNCWLAPSVASFIAHLQAIETAAVAYRDAVLKKRELGAKWISDPTHDNIVAKQQAEEQKQALGEALFALLK